MAGLRLGSQQQGEGEVTVGSIKDPLVEEFPDTKAAAKAQEWLGDNPGNVSALPARASRFMGR